MTPHILKELLPLLQSIHFMIQLQTQYIIQLLRIHQKAPKDIDMGLMTFTPLLKRPKVVEEAQAIRLLAVRLVRGRVDNVPEVVGVASNAFPLVAEEVHALDEDGVHGVEIEFSLEGERGGPVLPGADYAEVVFAWDSYPLAI